MKHLLCLWVAWALIPAAAHCGDTGTMDMSWSEFSQLNITCGAARIFSVALTTQQEKDCQKLHLSFQTQNTSAERIRYYYIISIFDDAGSLLFAAAEDHHLNKNELDDTEAQAPLPLGFKTAPARVKFRVIW